MSGLYALALVISLAGLATLDRKFRLAFWPHRRRTAVVVGVSVLGFLLWDLAGISLGIFFRGPGPWQSGLVIAPELPVEEVLFLTLLSYLSLLLYFAWNRRAESRGAR